MTPQLIDLPIEDACKAKWAAGQKVYGPVFVGHPLVNFDEEMIDALNYLDEAVRWGFDVGDMPDRIRAIAERARELYARSKL